MPSAKESFPAWDVRWLPRMPFTSLPLTWMPLTAPIRWNICLTPTKAAVCTHARNRALVNGADLCVAYLTAPRGGTLYTCSYAEKKGVAVLNLADKL